MGTHPIFESDFDCLTECQTPNSGLKAKDDEIILGKFKPGKPIMMIGSAEKDIEKVQAGRPEDLPEIINDLEDIGDDISVEQKEEHLNKIRKRIEKLEVTE